MKTSEQSSEGDPNPTILEISLALMRKTGMVIFEEAIVRANQRRHRHAIKWQKQRFDLEHHMGIGLIPMSRKFLRDLVGGEFPTLRVLAEVKQHIERTEHGAQKLGYCHPAKFEELTRRHIAHRRHVAEGNARLADRLEKGLDIRLPGSVDIEELPLAADKEESNG